ncbi:hypothetical protein [Bradyrhizobium sp. USDA 10063]
MFEQRCNLPSGCTGISADRRIIVDFQSIPISIAKKADEYVDGTIDATAGRIVYNQNGLCGCLLNGDTAVGGNASAGNATTVDVCYAANPA